MADPAFTEFGTLSYTSLLTGLSLTPSCYQVSFLSPLLMFRNNFVRPAVICTTKHNLKLVMPEYQSNILCFLVKIRT